MPPDAEETLARFLQALYEAVLRSPEVAASKFRPKKFAPAQIYSLVLLRRVVQLIEYLFDCWDGEVAMLEEALNALNAQLPKSLARQGSDDDRWLVRLLVNLELPAEMAPQRLAAARLALRILEWSNQKTQLAQLKAFYDRLSGGAPLTYRRLVTMLQQSRRLRETIQLRRVPTYSTLAKADAAWSARRSNVISRSSAATR